MAVQKPSDDCKTAIERSEWEGFHVEKTLTNPPVPPLGMGMGAVNS